MTEMRNLMPDPWPSRLSWGYVGGGAQNNMTLRMTNDKTGLHITTWATPPAWVGVWVTGMTPGREYVAAIIFDGEPITLLAKDEISGPSLAQVECTQPNNCYMIRFTPAGNRALVIVIAPSTVNAASAIKQFSVMSGEDWDNMRNLKNDDGTAANIRWFAPPKTAATGVMSTPALDRGGCSPSTARRYPHIDVEVAA